MITLKWKYHYETQARRYTGYYNSRKINVNVIILKWKYHYETQARRYTGSYNGVRVKWKFILKLVTEAALGSWNVARDCRYSGLEGLRKNSVQINRDFRNSWRDSNSVPLAHNSTPNLFGEPHYYSVRSSVTKWLPIVYLVPHFNKLLSQGATIYLSLSLSLSLSLP